MENVERLADMMAQLQTLWRHKLRLQMSDFYNIPPKHTKEIEEYDKTAFIYFKNMKAILEELTKE